MKKVLLTVLAMTLVFALAACSGNDNKESKGSDDNYKLKAMIAVQKAQDKVNTLFHKDQLKDERFVLTANSGDQAQVKSVLEKYMDAALADQVVKHYWTDEQVDGVVVVNQEAFFKGSLSGVAEADAAFEGDAEALKISKDNVTYEVKKVDGVYKLVSVTQ